MVGKLCSRITLPASGPLDANFFRSRGARHGSHDVQGWIYDHLKTHAAVLKTAHPRMLRAIVSAKKKNASIDASKICDCLRCDFMPECYMAYGHSRIFHRQNSRSRSSTTLDVPVSEFIG